MAGASASKHHLCAASGPQAKLASVLQGADSGPQLAVREQGSRTAAGLLSLITLLQCFLSVAFQEQIIFINTSFIFVALYLIHVRVKDL